MEIETQTNAGNDATSQYKHSAKPKSNSCKNQKTKDTHCRSSACVRRRETRPLSLETIKLSTFKDFLRPAIDMCVWCSLNVLCVNMDSSCIINILYDMPRRHSVATVLQLDYFTNISFEMCNFAPNILMCSVRWPPVIRAKVIRTHALTRTLIKPKKWNKMSNERASLYLSVCTCVFIKYKWHEACNLVSTKAIVPWWLNIIHSVMLARWRACVSVCICVSVCALYSLHLQVWKTWCAQY